MSAVKLVPRSILFGNPVKTMPRLSPDGRRVAFLAPDDGVLNVWLAGSDGEPDRPLTRDRGRGVQTYFWAPDSSRVLYMQDTAGDENWHLFSIDVEADSIRDLTPFLGVQGLPVDMSSERPDEILVSMNLRDPSLHDIHRVDLNTGAIVLDTENPGNVIGWVADRQLQVRAALGRTADGGGELIVRDDTSSPWRRLVLWGPDDDHSGPFGFTPDGKGLYLHDSRDSNAQKLVEIDLASGDSKVLAEDPVYDVSDGIFKPVTRAIQAVGFGRQKHEWQVLDAEFGQDWAAIEEKGGDGEVSLVSRDRADTVWIVAIHSDSRSLAFHQFDRESKKFAHLFDSQPALNEHELAPMKPISFAASDGLTLEGYLTLPSGSGEKRQRLPLVILVHGGPWARDEWGFDPEAQLLANRGYACLQINYRGSTGYGKEFLGAGDREWGARMQEDLVDGVGWAVEQGLADPDRVAIMGGSYGGYAALAGAAFNQGVFHCAVDMVGPSSLLTLIESIPPYWKPLRNTFDRRVGNIDTEREFLKSRSPLFHADKMAIPMLIAQGANDPRVKQAEAEQIVAALKEHDKEVEYLLYPDEGHGLVRPANRMHYYARVEAFLARHLGGQAEPE